MNIVMMGATGAVGGHVVSKLLEMRLVGHLTLLGRRPVEGLDMPEVRQHQIDIHTPDSYREFLPGHQAAICTLGVGQPSKISKEEFLKIDKLAVWEFAAACKAAGVRHFELLSSVGISSQSASFYLRSKGELVEEIAALGFERFSVFQPSMILTPTNRYGLAQGIALAVWPILNPVLMGSLKPYRGVPVDILGHAMALNIWREGKGIEYLKWEAFHEFVTYAE